MPGICSFVGLFWDFFARLGFDYGFIVIVLCIHWVIVLRQRRFLEYEAFFRFGIFGVLLFDFQDLFVSPVGLGASLLAFVEARVECFDVAIDLLFLLHECANPLVNIVQDLLYLFVLEEDVLLRRGGMDRNRFWRVVLVLDDLLLAARYVDD